MEKVERPIWIDIGGGKGEHFARLARHCSDKIYLVLDPEVRPIVNKPDNLHLVTWERGIGSSIPLRAGTVSEAHINFVMGEMNFGCFRAESVREALDAYDFLLVAVERVLVDGGKLMIVDVRGNIGYIQTILETRGYECQKPRRLEDEHYSVWTENFFRIFRELGRSEEDSGVLPMMIETSKVRLDKK